MKPRERESPFGLSHEQVANSVSVSSKCAKAARRNPSLSELFIILLSLRRAATLSPPFSPSFPPVPHRRHFTSTHHSPLPQPFCDSAFSTSSTRTRRGCWKLHRRSGRGMEETESRARHKNWIVKNSLKIQTRVRGNGDESGDALQQKPAYGNASANNAVPRMKKLYSH